jgi:hypothetical protein
MSSDSTTPCNDDAIPADTRGNPSSVAFPDGERTHFDFADMHKPHEHQ